MADILSCLHFRDFSSLQQQGAVPDLLCCCLPLLLQQYDAYPCPPRSLEAIIRRFPPEELQACRCLARIAARSGSPAAEGVAAPAAAAAATAGMSVSAEVGAAVAAACEPQGKGAEAVPAGEPHSAAPNELGRGMSCLWVCGGPGGPHPPVLSEEMLAAVACRFLSDVAAFPAAAAAGTAAEEAFVGAAVGLWGFLLPVLLPLFYTRLPAAAPISPAALVAASTATGSRQYVQQKRQQQEYRKTISGPHTRLSAHRAAPRRSSGGPHASPATAPAAAAAAATAAAAPAATRTAALRLCAAAVAWQWQRSSGAPAGGSSSEGPGEEAAGNPLNRLMHGPPWGDPAFCLAKPFLAVILCSETAEAAVVTAKLSIEVLLECLRSVSFSLSSPYPLLLGCIGSCSPSISLLLFLALSSPDLPQHFSPITALQLCFSPSADLVLHAAVRRTLSLASLRGPFGVSLRPGFQGAVRALRPGPLGALLRRKAGLPHHKAELLLSYYVFCFDYEQQQTQRILAAAAAAAPAAAAAAEGSAGCATEKQLTEEETVAAALRFFLEEAAEGPQGPLSAVAVAVGAPPLTKNSTVSSHRGPLKGFSTEGLPDDRCGRQWGVFAVGETVGLLDLSKVHAAAGCRFGASLARVVLLALRLCCRRSEGSPQREAEMGALSGACSLMLGESLRHPETWGEVTQRLGVLLYCQQLGAPTMPSVGMGFQWPQEAQVTPNLLAEEVHASLRGLLPRALPVSPFLSLRDVNQSLFAFLFRGFADAWQAWGAQTTQQQQQQQQENEAVLGVLAAHVSSTTTSLFDALSPLIILSQGCPAQGAPFRGGPRGPCTRLRPGATECEGGREGRGPPGSPDELLSLQCLLFLCECGREAFAAALYSSPRELLRRQAQGEGGSFFGLPYAGLQRWQHLVAAFCAFLERHTAPTGAAASPSFSSPLDYPDILCSLRQHSFLVVGADAESPFGRAEAFAVEKEEMLASCIAVMLLYLIAKMHSLPYFMAKDGRYLRRLHSLPWHSATLFVSSHPTLSHWMLRLFMEALQACLPETALLEGPLPPVSLSELLPCGALHPAALAEADAADSFSRVAANLALESFSLTSWPSEEPLTIEGPKCLWQKNRLPSAAGVQRRIALWIKRAVKATCLEAPALEAEVEELQLYLASEPLAGVAATVCCLVDAFFEQDGERLPQATPLSSDWSPTADDVPAEPASKEEEGAEPQTKFTEEMLDAHYLCIIQNPLNLLLHLPAQLMLKLLTTNVLGDVILTLLLKLETYARMGPPALAGLPAELIAADEIVQLQETAAFQVLIEVCCFSQDEAAWELLGRLLDQHASRRPQSLDILFASGFPLEAVDRVCRCSKEVQRLLPLLCHQLRQTASFFWETQTRKSTKDAALEEQGMPTPPSTAAEEPSPEPSDGVRIKANQTTTVHPALAPLSRVDLCLFYLKCIVCVACDLRDNRPYPGDSRETDPSFASENANAVFLEAIKHLDLQVSCRLCEFVAASVPIIFPLFYTFPKLGALVSTFLAHRKLLRHDGNVKEHLFGISYEHHDSGYSLAKKRADAVLEQLEQDLSRVIELDL